MQFSIEDKDFVAKNFSLQHAIEYDQNFPASYTGRERNVISYSLDIGSNPSYKDFFTNLYDRQFSPSPLKSYKFTIKSRDYTAVGCMIISLDINVSSGAMNLQIRPDFISIMPLSSRRDSILNDLLPNQTFDTNGIIKSN